MFSVVKKGTALAILSSGKVHHGKVLSHSIQVDFKRAVTAKILADFSDSRTQSLKEICNRENYFASSRKLEQKLK